MTILAAYALPHPPLIVPRVGRGEEHQIQATVDAYTAVAARIKAYKPDTLVISSPHAPFYRDGFFVSLAQRAYGDMSRFQAYDEELSVNCDLELAEAIRREAADSAGIPTTSQRMATENLDHGTYIPLYFLKDALDSLSIVRLGLSMLPGETHKELGHCIRKAAQDKNRRMIFIASGDLSHKLKASGPYGFDPAGPEFDEAIESIFATGNLDELFTLNSEMCENAAECGLRSFQIMAGVLEGLDFSAELLSHEGTFGVGYGIGAFEVEE